MKKALKILKCKRGLGVFIHWYHECDTCDTCDTLHI